MPEQSPFQYFTLKLVSPRSSFPSDMTAEEGAITQQHIADNDPAMQLTRYEVLQIMAIVPQQ